MISGLEANKSRELIWERLNQLRAGPFGENRRRAKAEQMDTIGGDELETGV